MSFQYPSVLFALVFPVLLLVFVWRRKEGRVLLPFDHGRPRSGRLLRSFLDVAESLPAFLLAAIVILLAGPQRLSEPKTRRVLTNIEFCVDISGSMSASFGSGSRYDASMQAINDFLDYREGDAFGLTFFGNSVLHWVPLTSDTSAIRCAPPFMKPELAPPWFGGTEIGKALLACKEVLSRRERGDRMIILVSDGYSFDLGGGNDAEIIRTLRKHDIVVYAVHIATSAIPDPIVDITSMTGGEVFNPGDPEGLRAVFQRIDEMQETRLEKISAEKMDNFFSFCVASLSFLGLSLMSLLGLRYTPW